MFRFFVKTEWRDLNLSWILIALILSTNVLADDGRLKPIVLGALELHDAGYSDEKAALFSDRFSQLESVLGNSKTYLWVTRDDEVILDSAQSAACELLGDRCLLNEVSEAIATVPSVDETQEGFSTLSVKLDDTTYQIIFVSDTDEYRNGRAILAFQAFTKLFINRQVNFSSPIPEWLREGQEEYLSKAILSSMRLETGNSFGSYHNQVTSDIAGRVIDNAPLSVLESNYLDISSAAIIRLVHDYGMRSVFISFYDMHQSGLTWDETFYRSFNITPTDFSKSLESQIENGLDLGALREPNDLIDALEEPWRSNETSARALFDISPFKLLHVMEYSKTEGCPHTITISSYEYGDFNGDGYEDIVLGIEEYDGYNQHVDPMCSAPTHVVVIYGSETNASPDLSIIDSDALGNRDSVVADVNGDGIDDVLVVGAFHKDGSEGAYQADSPPISAMNLYLGSTEGLLKSTADVDNQTNLDLGDMRAEFATHGDLDGDGVEEFFFYGIGDGDPWPQPIVIDCPGICVAKYPSGFNYTTYPALSGVAIYNGALLDIDRDSDLDILINIEVDSQYDMGEPFASKRYSHAVYLQRDGIFDMSLPPDELALGFRLDNNTIPPIPDDDRILDIDATHYWESEVIDLTGDGVDELVTLENNQFHVLNPRFLISVYSHDIDSDVYSLTAQQPGDTKAQHDQNLVFRDLNGDTRLDIISTLSPKPDYRDTIAIHENIGSSWSLSTKGFNTFMEENMCNKIYTPDFDNDGNLDVVVACVRRDQLEIYFAGNQLTADRDRDGIPDELEIKNGTNPNLADSDSDGVIDNIDMFPVDSLEQIDTDSDGIGNNADTDDDGDGLSDSQEAIYGTNPLLKDTDSDGYTDTEETAAGTDPLDANSIPSKGLPIWLIKAAKDKMEQDTTN
jgi:hypothetical protein